MGRGLFETKRLYRLWHTPAASDKQTHTELNRWFLIVADSVDAIAAVCCSPLPTGRGGHC